MYIKTIYLILISVSFLQCMPAKKYATVDKDIFIEKKANDDTTTFGDRVISSTLRFSILDKENNQYIVYPTILINKIPIQVDSANKNKTKLFSGNYRFEIIAVGFHKKKWNLKTNKNYNYNINVRMDRNTIPFK